MKNKDLKSDIVAENIVKAFGYIAKNKTTFFIIVVGISFSIWYFYPEAIDQVGINDSRQEADRISLKRINDTNNLAQLAQTGDAPTLIKIEESNKEFDAGMAKLSSEHKSTNYQKLSTNIHRGN